MATPRVLTTLTPTWAAIEGAAASVAGMTWHNNGPDQVAIAFTTSAPGASDAVHVLQKGQAYYDKTGSAKVWGRSLTTVGAQIAGSSD